MLTSVRVKSLFPREEELCRLFAAEMERLGWTVYPETGGFDLLLVWGATGHQLGVEAKLTLNAKVADQIIPDCPTSFPGAWEAPGPDFRAVIVPSLTDASRGIAKALRLLGINVWDVADQGHGPSFLPSIAPYGGTAPWDPDTSSIARDFQCVWHDFNPAVRCVLPELRPTVRAGVPAPVRLSPWKIGALKVLADLELDGFVTARSVRAHGIDPRRFCASDGWLAPLGGGKWSKGKVPAFDAQHPLEYATLLAKARSQRA